MASWGDLQTLTTPAGVITFVSPLSSASGLIVEPKQCTGLGSGDVRAAIDDRAGESGYILHPEWYEAGAQFVLGGMIRAADVAERDSIQTATKTCLRSILSATGTLSFGSSGSLTVRWNLGIDFPAIDSWLKGFRFGVVCADPW